MNISAPHKAHINEALCKADEICNARGQRFTELRRRVLELIWASDGPAKAYDLLDQLKGEDGPAKPPTIYRTLHFLLENGLVHKLRSLNAYVGCSHPLQHSNCYFLICKTCQDIVECCNDELAEALKKTTQKNNFDIKHVTLEIEGVCQKCAKA